MTVVLLFKRSATTFLFILLTHLHPGSNFCTEVYGFQNAKNVIWDVQNGRFLGPFSVLKHQNGPKNSKKQQKRAKKHLFGGPKPEKSLYFMFFRRFCKRHYLGCSYSRDSGFSKRAKKHRFGKAADLEGYDAPFFPGSKCCVSLIYRCFSRDFGSFCRFFRSWKRAKKGVFRPF